MSNPAHDILREALQARRAYKTRLLDELRKWKSRCIEVEGDLVKNEAAISDIEQSLRDLGAETGE